jgi:MFS family permease
VDTRSAIRTTIPARLDALPWSAWHWRVVIALGVSWLLDGLEVTVVGSLGPTLQRGDTLALGADQVGWAASAYIGGAVIGALVFGRLADRLGRKKIFLVTLVIYLAATVATAFSFNLASFALCRFVTGFGIGGEYAAINSAIDELIPARLRGTIDLAVNGTFWVGAALGALLSILLLNNAFLDADLAWRLSFGLGGVLSFAILLVRRHVPESPRWLLMHGREAEAEGVVQDIERAIEQEKGPLRMPSDLHVQRSMKAVPWKTIVTLLVTRYRKRTVLGLALMAAQAFFYNAIFFTYALVLTRFYDVKPESVGYYIFPFAVGNFLGPLVLGRLFDHVGRRVMIASTYAIAGLGLFFTGYLFSANSINETELAIAWSAIFFIASAAASAAYLTVSEIFPLEMRAVSISLFYACGTALGGFAGPPLFGAMIESGSRPALFGAYSLAAVLMVGAGLVAAFLGVDAERKPLEHVAPPLGSL